MDFQGDESNTNENQESLNQESLPDIEKKK